MEKTSGRPQIVGLAVAVAAASQIVSFREQTEYN
jgi:hypothetical protein